MRLLTYFIITILVRRDELHIHKDALVLRIHTEGRFSIYATVPIPVL
jgi:hypothetical protein